MRHRSRAIPPAFHRHRRTSHRPHIQQFGTNLDDSAFPNTFRIERQIQRGGRRVDPCRQPVAFLNNTRQQITSRLINDRLCCSHDVTSRCRQSCHESSVIASASRNTRFTSGGTHRPSCSTMSTRYGPISAWISTFATTHTSRGFG